MKQSSLNLCLLAGLSLGCPVKSADLSSENPTAEDESLISIALSTDPTQEVAPGEFRGTVMAHERDVSALHDCSHEVEQLADEWAREQDVRLVARDSSDGLMLKYSANEPPGYFYLRYRFRPARVDVAFWFRSLSNVRLSGEELAMRPLGRRLLEAAQCVP